MTSGGLFADAALARLLETAEAEACRDFCEAAARLYPGGSIRCVPCAGGYGLHYGRADPLNAVKGVGVSGSVPTHEWHTLEEAFHGAGSPVVIDLAPPPLSDESFWSLLMERGYRVAAFETVMSRTLHGPRPDTRDVHRGVRIELIENDPERIGLWGRVLDIGFADGGEPAKFAVDIARVRASIPHAVMLLARVGDEPAGGAGMSIRGPVAHMAGAAVLPAFRGCGIQRALTAARLRIARERGCTHAKIDVRAGTVSHRNAVRSGFQVAYTRPQLVRNWDSPAPGAD